MTDINNTAALAAPEKKEKKFCFAVIPALLFTVISFFSLLANLFYYVSVDGAYGSFPFSSIVFVLCWLIFSVFLFFKLNNIITPVLLGVTLLLPNITSLIVYFISYFYNYTPSFIQIYGIFWRAIVTAVCVLFVLKAPAIKAFIRKTKFIWIIATAVLILSEPCIQTIDFISDTISNGVKIISVIPYLLGLLLSYIPLCATIVLLLLWLSDPYKKARPQEPAVQPVYQPQPRPVAQPPVQAQPIHVVLPPIQAQPAAQTNVADEIKKYKDLLDSGVITPEEFESAKAKLLNKI